MGTPYFRSEDGNWKTSGGVLEFLGKGGKKTFTRDECRSLAGAMALLSEVDGYRADKKIREDVVDLVGVMVEDGFRVTPDATLLFQGVKVPRAGVEWVAGGCVLDPHPSYQVAVWNKGSFTKKDKEIPLFASVEVVREEEWKVKKGEPQPPPNFDGKLLTPKG